MSDRRKRCEACDQLTNHSGYTPVGVGPFSQDCLESLIDPDQSWELEQRCARLEVESRPIAGAEPGRSGMKKQSRNGHFLAELTRLRSLHHCHDAARSLTNGIHDFPLEKRGSIADVVRQLENVEECLKQLRGNHDTQR